MKKIFFKSKDGLRLCGIWDYPDKSTTKAIVLAHGITVDKEESGIFTELSKLLQENGFTVMRFDFRGHGESEGKSTEMTIFGQILDLESAIHQVQKQNYKNIGLLGASFGGGVATLYTAKHQNSLRSLCLWNPCLNYDHTFINPTLPWILQKKGHMKKDLQEKGWTTVGSRKYKIGTILWEEMKILTPFEELKKINLPTVIIHGDKDTYVPYSDSKQYVKYLKNGNLITIQKAEHGFHDVTEHREKAKQETLKFFLKYL